MDLHNTGMTRIGLVSDTHGTLRPGTLEGLAGVDLILHAGDVGRLDVLDALGGVAPVRAVRGNVDPAGEPRLEDALVLDLEGHSLRVTHGDEVRSPRPASLLARYPEGILVFGHTHAALVHPVGARLVINPGSAGPPRFRLRPSFALLELARGAAPRVVVRTLP